MADERLRSRRYEERGPLIDTGLVKLFHDKKLLGYVKKIWPLVSVLALCSLIQFIGVNAPLQYDRELISVGQWWRLLSGHLVHLSWFHLQDNALALAALWFLFYRFSAGLLFLFELLWCCLGVGVGLYFFSPEVAWYVGLSGALHGLFVLRVCLDVHSNRRVKGVLLVLLAIKLAVEQGYGSWLDSRSIGGEVVVDAHLYGALTGLIGAVIVRGVLIAGWKLPAIFSQTLRR